MWLLEKHIANNKKTYIFISWTNLIYEREREDIASRIPSIVLPNMEDIYNTVTKNSTMKGIITILYFTNEK